MSLVVDFTDVSTEGLESSPVVDALAGLRANEARYFRNKYDHVFTTEPAAEAQPILDRVHTILREERDIEIASPPLEATEFEVDGIRWSYVFYESGLSINVLYTLEPGGKRAVGFKLSDGMEIPAELADKFKFARQKSKLAGTIRGSFFVIKGEY
jgi:hypothetical protein